MRSCRLLQCCETPAEERSAGNPHATFCGNGRRATASCDPVGEEKSSSLPRPFPWTSAYVGCLRASGLVMLAARFSESDPELPSARRGRKSPDSQRTHGLEPGQFGGCQIMSVLVADQRLAGKNLTRRRDQASPDPIHLRAEQI